MQFKELQKMVDSYEEKETNSVRIIDLFDPLAMQKIITCFMQKVEALDKENQKLKAEINNLKQQEATNTYATQGTN